MCKGEDRGEGQHVAGLWPKGGSWDPGTHILDTGGEFS